MADMSAKLEGDRATAATAERKIESSERLGVAQLLTNAEERLDAARIRAQGAKERNDERVQIAKDELERKKLADKDRAIKQAQENISNLYSRLKSVNDAYGMVSKLPPDMQKSEQFRDQYNNFKRDYDGLLAQINQAERRLSTLLGDEAPVRSAPSGPRQRYDASGNPIR